MHSAYPCAINLKIYFSLIQFDANSPFYQIIACRREEEKIFDILLL